MNLRLEQVCKRYPGAKRLALEESRWSSSAGS